MTPMPIDPKVVAMVNDKGQVVKVASNVTNDTRVEVVTTVEAFDEAAKGLPFNGLQRDSHLL